jgi:hypothetical protein
MGKSPTEDERKFLLGIRDLLRGEREVEKREAYEDRVRARVLDVTEDLVTLECSFPKFKKWFKVKNSFLGLSKSSCCVIFV